jgi:UDP-3-O-[3-hydroxymyristoyl] glucosamine N-acyltransferase
MPISLGELATRFGCELIGDPETLVDNVASLQNAGQGSLSFLSSTAYKSQLPSTKAAVVVLRDEDAADSPVASLIAADPYAMYARMAAVVVPARRYDPGIHPSAVVADGAFVDATAHVAPNAYIDSDAKVGANVYVGAGAYVGPDCVVGDSCRLLANVTLVRAVSMGSRCIIHPGAVIGGDGFGNAMTPEGWVKVPQLGGVQIGSDVEIGCNTTVDCGAIDDTVIEDGVRLDNLVMIGHNVRIGAHTAMASMAAIAGSTVIGKRCMFAGMSGTVGHIRICDDVVVNGKGMISKSIKEPGVYASSFPAEKVRDWNRRVARIRRLDALTERVKKLENRES